LGVPVWRVPLRQQEDMPTLEDIVENCLGLYVVCVMMRSVKR